MPDIFDESEAAPLSQSGSSQPKSPPATVLPVANDARRRRADGYDKKKDRTGTNPDHSRASGKRQERGCAAIADHRDGHRPQPRQGGPVLFGRLRSEGARALPESEGQEGLV